MHDKAAIDLLNLFEVKTFNLNTSSIKVWPVFDNLYILLDHASRDIVEKMECNQTPTTFAKRFALIPRA